QSGFLSFPKLQPPTPSPNHVLFPRPPSTICSPIFVVLPTLPSSNAQLHEHRRHRKPPPPPPRHCRHPSAGGSASLATRAVAAVTAYAAIGYRYPRFAGASAFPPSVWRPEWKAMDLGCAWLHKTLGARKAGKPPTRWPWVAHWRFETCYGVILCNLHENCRSYRCGRPISNRYVLDNTQFEILDS
uniref:Uncharacterized protein n=1 Tax=Aegilops tauschii subsp. strangulata TaxID=200361 RepID=A0A453RJ96_AEGTS